MTSPNPLTIIVTDSGLGGLSTTADLCQRLSKQGPSPKINIIYFNALADNAMGYNNMKTVEQKVAVFNNALASMHRNFCPDYILIACNTLSVIHEHTAFSKSNFVPVIGIVDTSVKLMLDFLNKTPNSQIIIFGTETTTTSNVYPQRLKEKGIAAQRIISESGSTTHVEIENDAHSTTTRHLIDKHVAQAITRLANPKAPVGVSLNCTHYGYSLDFFSESFKKHGVHLSALINPNIHMSDFLFEEKALLTQPQLTVKVVSQAEISMGKIDAMSRLIGPTAPELATALQTYRHENNLFEWKTLV